MSGGVGLVRPWARKLGEHALRYVTDRSGTSALLDFELPLPTGATGMQWAYPVPDDDSDASGDVVLSCAADHKIFACLLALGSLDGASATGRVADMLASITWVEVQLPAAATATWYTGAADHAHLAAHGAHWISVQLASAMDSEHNDLWLLKLERADIEYAVATGGKVAPRVQRLVYSADHRTAVRYDALVIDTDRTYSTNDHFLQAVPGGVRVVIANAAAGTLLPIEVDPFTLQLQSASEWNPAALGIRANTTGSARGPTLGELTPSFRLVFPDTVVTNVAQNNLHLVETDSSWSVSSLAASLSLAGYSLQMPSFLVLLDGSVVLALKLLPCTAVPATTPTYWDGEPVFEDWGYVHLFLLERGLAGLLQVVPLALAGRTSLTTGGNRPHLNRWGRWVLACWDQATLPDPNAPEQYATDFRSRLRVMYLETS